MCLVAAFALLEGGTRLLGLEFERRHGLRACVAVERDHGKVRRKPELRIAALIEILDDDVDGDLHRAVSDVDDICRHDDEVADADRQVKLELIDACRDNVRARVAPRRRVCCRVHQLHDLAAVDIPVRVGLTRHHDFADDDAAVLHFAFTHILFHPFHKLRRSK